jgi:hypothetical protein
MRMRSGLFKHECHVLDFELRVKHRRDVLSALGLPKSAQQHTSALRTFLISIDH